MAKEFFNRDMEFFLDHRVDWARYFRLARGADATSGAMRVETYKMVLRTAGEICESIEAGARDHWHEQVGSQGRRGGRAAAHRRRLRASCATQASVCLTARARSMAATACRPDQHRLSRDGRARRLEPDDHRRPAGGRGARHREVRQRRAQAALPAALRQRRVPGLHGPDRAAGGLRPRRHRDPGHARRTAATSSTARRSSSPTAAPTCTSSWRATPRPTTSRKGPPTASA